MYERFIDRARHALALAAHEAQRFNHEYIGTEHILLALLKVRSSAALQVLNGLDVYAREICLNLEKLMDPGSYPAELGKRPYTPRAKQVIDHAFEESKKLKHTYLGTEHLLLGLWTETGGLAAKVILKLNIPIRDVREEVLRLLREGINTGEHPPKRNSTQQPRKIMTLATEEARRLKHEFIGTEHILLAIASIRTGFVPHLFDRFGITGEELRDAVEKTVPRGKEASSEAKLPHTPNARKVLEYSIEEARNLEHSYIGCEHLLLSLSRIDDCRAIQALSSLFIEPDDLRFEMLQLLGTGGLSDAIVERDPLNKRHHSLFHRMNDRITDRARNVLRLATAEAIRLRHDSLKAEHLLFGMLKHGHGLASEALKHQGIDLIDLQARSAEALAAMTTSGLAKHPRASASLRFAIEHAIEGAQGFNHDYVGTEHLLLGILREENSPAAQLLEQYGVTLEKSRRVIRELLGQ
ncbi:hypothetical protein K2Y11_17885 [bacterium]|nr:hypothetical protein [bacterium]